MLQPLYHYFCRLPFESINFKIAGIVVVCAHVFLTLKGKHCWVTKIWREEKEDLLAGLNELETYVASDSGDDSWGEKKEEKVMYEWQDFFDD